MIKREDPHVKAMREHFVKHCRTCTTGHDIVFATWYDVPCISCSRNPNTPEEIAQNYTEAGLVVPLECYEERIDKFKE